jgi:hypothetical protein
MRKRYDFPGKSKTCYQSQRKGKSREVAEQTHHFKQLLKELILGRFTDAPVLLWLCIRGMSKEDHFKCRIHHLLL